MSNLLAKITCFTTAILFSGCSLVGYNHNTETAEYEVLAKDGKIEIRKYAPMLLVQTKMAPHEEGERVSFRRLFDYISGKNTQNTKIAMTTPVVQESTQSDGAKIAMTTPVFTSNNSETMSFVITKDFSAETVPQPLDEAVWIKEEPEKLVAVISFSGRKLDKTVEKKKSKLEDWISENGYLAISPHQYAGYNPPWTIPVFRRNEILITVLKNSS